jgi:outer membrane biosynthesis protein TonB
MSLDRAELTGTGAAVVFHVALIAALSMSLASVTRAPEPPSMTVDLVEEVGLQSAAPEPAAPPPPSQAPEIGPAEPTQAAPAVRPTPAPSMTPALARPQPARPAKPAKPAPRASRIGDDFLKGIADTRASAEPAKPAAATFDAQAKVSIGQAILRQVKPCADRQPYLGEGANEVRLTVNLRLGRSGRLARPPSILRTSGDPDLVAKYGELLEDQVRRIFAQCTPLRLPGELYDTPTGGWGNFTFSYRVD